MRCLWLTLADPEPRHNGQFIYSGGLIEALANAGALVDVLGLSRPESNRTHAVDGNVRWWLADHQPLSRWASLASCLPHIAHRCQTADMQRLLGDLLRQDGWDCIVFDGISVGWAMRPVLQHYSNKRRRPKLVYISHNHEESIRAQIASNQEQPLKRQAMWLDALKVRLLERRLVDAVDLVTAITPEDGSLYKARRPDKRIDILTPGYQGRHVAGRRITTDFPRRAVIVGSFDWVAKRMNLEEFVSVADPVFASHRAELQVIGSAEESFLNQLRKKVTATVFTGTVGDVTDYMDAARIAIVPERNGGGFKLKVLEYVFNRLPILALDGSVAGVPLRQDRSILLYPDHAALAQGVLNVMDDLKLLNSLQDHAYAECRDKFDWSSRGKQLIAAIAAL
ncbi:MAG TPA: glycosyltransferase [Alphaproteobacteria bacterium]|nr:glycosyltransferase [Alphaproteobacteria bacterium]